MPSPSLPSIFSLQQRPRGPTYIKTTNPLQDKMASLSSPSSISFKRPFDPISNISPWQSCAPVTRQLRQNHNPNHNPNRSRSWSAELANALSWRHRSTPTTKLVTNFVWGRWTQYVYYHIFRLFIFFLDAGLQYLTRFCQKVYDKTNHFTSYNPIEVY